MIVKILLTLSFVLSLFGDGYRDSPYIDNKNGTITDNVTKLIWQKCSIGQNNDYLCSGQATFHNWEEAQLQCSSLKLGNKKWRLPKLEELNSLFVSIKYDKLSIDQNSFPNPSTEYWTSSKINGNIFNNWYINFYDPRARAPENPNVSMNVRCVSGDIFSNFVESNSGVITDKKSGLKWQKCSIGQKYNRECTGKPLKFSWEDGIKKCRTLSLDGRKWRLPTLMEIAVINQNPEIDKILLIPSEVKYEKYWSSSSEDEDKNSAFAIYSFSTEGVSYQKSDEFYIRCVSN